MTLFIPLFLFSKMPFLFTTKTSPECQICGGREGPGNPGDDIVTDGGSGGSINGLWNK